MAIPTTFRQITEAISRRRASKKGAELTSGGKVLVGTTEGFVEVPEGSSLARDAEGGSRGGSRKTTKEDPAKAAAEKAKADALTKQREARAENVRQRRELTQKLRGLSVSERSKFIIERAEKSRSQALESLRSEGRRLTPESERLIERV